MRPQSAKPPIRKEKYCDLITRQAQKVDTVQISLQQQQNGNTYNDKNKENFTSLVNKMNLSPQITENIYKSLRINNFFFSKQDHLSPSNKYPSNEFSLFSSREKSMNKQPSQNQIQSNTLIYTRNFKQIYQIDEEKQSQTQQYCDIQRKFSSQFEFIENDNAEQDLQSNQNLKESFYQIQQKNSACSAQQQIQSQQKKASNLNSAKFRNKKSFPRSQINLIEKYLPSYYYSYSKLVAPSTHQITLSPKQTPPNQTFYFQKQLFSEHLKQKQEENNQFNPAQSFSTRYSSRNNSITKTTANSTNQNSKNTSIPPSQNSTETTPINNSKIFVKKHTAMSFTNYLQNRPPSSVTQRQGTLSSEQDRCNSALRTTQTQCSQRTIQTIQEIFPSKQRNQNVRVQSALRNQQDTCQDQKNSQRQVQDLEEISFIDVNINIEDCVPLKKGRQNLKIPGVSAKSWVIIDGCNGQMIEGKFPHCQREVASLTKIMTCYTVLKFFQKEFNKDMKKVFIKVSNRSASMGGTSACLQCNHSLSVWDLLHGMMLPSGNDAAVCLAENIGSLMYLLFAKKDEEIRNDDLIYNMELLQEKIENEVLSNTGMNKFLQQMNNNAVELKMANTYYSNPHGLKNPLNRSTALDVAKLCAVTMRNEQFKEIVCTQKYEAQGQKRKNISTQYIKNKFNNYEMFNYSWQNTNKLLEKNWSGIKTGITEAAGPCLASCIKLREKSTNINRCVIVVVLSSLTKDIRWIECQQLAAYALQQNEDEE